MSYYDLLDRQLHQVNAQRAPAQLYVKGAPVAGRAATADEEAQGAFRRRAHRRFAAGAPADQRERGVDRLGRAHA